MRSTATHFVTSLIALLAIGLSPAIAETSPQTATRDADRLIVSAHTHAASLPLPTYINADDGDVSSNVDIYRQSVPGGELVEVVEAGTKIDDWTHMTAVFVMDRAAMPIDMHKQLLGSAFKQNCAEDKLFFEAVNPMDEGGLPLALLVCEEFKTSIQQTGAGLGEIMAVAIVQSAEATARIYVEWRGPAFNASDVRTWPVGDINDFQKTMERLSSASAIAAVRN